MKIKMQTRLPDGKNMRVIFPLTHSLALYRRVNQQRIKIGIHTHIQIDRQKRIKIGITHIHTHIQTDRQKRIKTTPCCATPSGAAGRGAEAGDM